MSRRKNWQWDIKNRCVAPSCALLRASYDGNHISYGLADVAPYSLDTSA